MRVRKRKLIGVAAGIAAAVLMGVYASSVSATAARERTAALARYGGEQAEVCVAVRELAAGEVIEKSDVELRPWLADLIPEGAAASVDEVVGQRVAYPVAANEPVVIARLSEHSQELAVPEGLVAVSVPADEVMAVGGSIANGSTVDVYTTGSVGTTLLLPSVLVLETSADAGAQVGASLGSARSRSALSWVTLAVSPSSVEQLVAASRQGNLYFTLPGESASSATGSKTTGQAGVDGDSHWNPAATPSESSDKGGA